MIRFSCPQCHLLHHAPEKSAGQKFSCSCGQRIQIPNPPALPLSKTVSGKVDDFVGQEALREKRSPISAKVLAATLAGGFLMLFFLVAAVIIFFQDNEPVPLALEDLQAGQLKAIENHFSADNEPPKNQPQYEMQPPPAAQSVIAKRGPEITEQKKDPVLTIENDKPQRPANTHTPVLLPPKEKPTPPKKEEKQNKEKAPSKNLMLPLVMEKEIAERVKKAGGRIGKVTVSLAWTNKNDLDLHVVTASGEKIYYKNKRSRCGGTLDIDQNVRPTTDSPVENVFWPEESPPKGPIEIFVHHYRNHGLKGCQDPTRFVVRVQIDKEIKLFKGAVSFAGNRMAFVAKIPIPSAKEMQQRKKRIEVQEKRQQTPEFKAAEAARLAKLHEAKAAAKREKNESEGARKLKIALSFFADGLKQEKKGKIKDADRVFKIVVRQLQEIIRDYPETPVAEASRKFIKENFPRPAVP